MLCVVSLLIAFGVLGATTRLTHLIVEDRLTLRLRQWAITRYGAEGWQTYLVMCPWCVSPYIATIVTLPAVFWGMDHLPWHIRIVIAALLIPTASQAAGMYARKE